MSDGIFGNGADTTSQDRLIRLCLADREYSLTASSSCPVFPRVLSQTYSIVNSKKLIAITNLETADANLVLVKKMLQTLPKSQRFRARRTVDVSACASTAPNKYQEVLGARVDKREPSTMQTHTELCAANTPAFQCQGCREGQPTRTGL